MGYAIALAQSFIGGGLVQAGTVIPNYKGPFGEYLKPCDEEGNVIDGERETVPVRKPEALDQKALLAEARKMGLTPHHATGPEKLREMIEEAKAKDGGGQEEPPEDKNLPDA